MKQRNVYVGFALREVGFYEKNKHLIFEFQINFYMYFSAKKIISMQEVSFGEKKESQL
jgi:hypothetical protein